MTPERLAEIRRSVTQWAHQAGGWRTIDIADLAGELLEHVAELTTQRDDARRIAICSGIFQDHRGTDYEFDSDQPHEWRADPVGPVAWDKQTEQP